MTEKQQSDVAVRRGKLRRAVLALLAILLISAIPVAAWLNFQRQIAAVTKVGNPYSIVIGAGAGEDHRLINISGIDMMAEGNKETYVFSVLSRLDTNYKLQLAYTTNNPFTYTLYHAEECDENDANKLVEYVTQTPETKYYKITDTIGTAIGGSFMNPTKSVPIDLSTDSTSNITVAETDAETQGAEDAHEFSYGDYPVINVETRVEPLYWQSNLVSFRASSENQHPAKIYNTPIRIGDDAYYCDYYILEISWPANLQSELINNKETDIIYITAEVG